MCFHSRNYWEQVTSKLRFEKKNSYLRNMNAALIFLLVGILVILVGTILFYLQTRQHKHKEQLHRIEIRKVRESQLSPLRVAAFERLIIMLERSRPSALVMRASKAGINASFLQLEIIKSLREEFEHNVSLQLYVSESTWQNIQDAKAEVTELVKVAFSKVDPNGPAIQLAHWITELEAAAGTKNLDAAIRAVRIELLQLS
ncbi:MAG: hypothetical protein RIR06_855 [Bacteroidota bacterium]